MNNLRILRHNGKLLGPKSFLYNFMKRMEKLWNIKVMDLFMEIHDQLHMWIVSGNEYPNEINLFFYDLIPNEYAFYFIIAIDLYLGIV